VNVVTSDPKNAAFTFGVGCTSQEVTDALDKSKLFMITAAASKFSAICCNQNAKD
jgi:hypothetical protein